MVPVQMNADRSLLLASNVTEPEAVDDFGRKSKLSAPRKSEVPSNGPRTVELSMTPAADWTRLPNPFAVSWKWPVSRTSTLSGWGACAGAGAAFSACTWVDTLPSLTICTDVSVPSDGSNCETLWVLVQFVGRLANVASTSLLCGVALIVGSLLKAKWPLASAVVVATT